VLERIVAYFSHRHLLANFIFLGVFIAGIFAWQNTSKEELPDVTFDMIRISVRYPGATAEEVEHFVTRPVEDAVRGLDGIYRVKSTSSMNSCSVTVELQPDNPDKNEIFTEIRNTVLDVKFPDDVTDEPSFRQFKTATKAIIDIGLYNEKYHLLDYKGRHELQTFVLALENQLLNLPEVHSVSKSGYRREEIHIQADPKKLVQYNIPFNTVMREIKNSHVRQPAGSIEVDDDAKVTLMGELDTIDKLNELAIQGGFDGRLIKLGDVADISQSFEKDLRISKVNGYEGIFLNVVKNSSCGILEALEAVNRAVEKFRGNLAGSDIKVILLDDESVDLRNRLSLITINGTIGFILILTMLFIFLDFTSGIWVALGIPFTFCFTLISSYLLGYTINNITLAAVIIVMGMVVDDAIVVAENIGRMRAQGCPSETASVKGTAYVFLPIVASIVTTCVAFIPMYFFTGRHARMVTYIPPIIILMLAGSLFESLFILPGHMNISITRFIRSKLAFLPFIGQNRQEQHSNGKTHWFNRIEDRYGSLLEKILPYKWIVFLSFIVLLIGSGYILKTRMKYVMFPNEETRQVRLNAEAPPGTTRLETAERSRVIDEVLKPYLGREVIGYRASIARSRWGGAVEDNRLRMRIEILPRKKKEKKRGYAHQGVEQRT